MRTKKFTKNSVRYFAVSARKKFNCSCKLNTTYISMSNNKKQRKKKIVLQLSRMIAKKSLAKIPNYNAFKQYIQDQVIVLADQIVQKAKGQIPTDINSRIPILVSITTSACNHRLQRYVRH